jgi:hypothetical protein
VYAAYNEMSKAVMDENFKFVFMINSLWCYVGGTLTPPD